MRRPRKYVSPRLSEVLRELQAKWIATDKEMASALSIGVFEYKQFASGRWRPGQALTFRIGILQAEQWLNPDTRPGTTFLTNLISSRDRIGEEDEQTTL